MDSLPTNFQTPRFCPGPIHTLQTEYPEVVTAATNLLPYYVL